MFITVVLVLYNFVIYVQLRALYTIFKPFFFFRWFESDRIWAAGLIVGEVSKRAYHWRAKCSIGAWLAQHRVPGICDIDTRALTCRLREGITLGKIIQGLPPSTPLPPFTDPNLRNLVAEVSIKVIY